MKKIENIAGFIDEIRANLSDQAYTSFKLPSPSIKRCVYTETYIVCRTSIERFEIAETGYLCLHREPQGHIQAESSLPVPQKSVSLTHCSTSVTVVAISLQNFTHFYWRGTGRLSPCSTKSSLVVKCQLVPLPYTKATVGHCTTSGSMWY